MEKNVMNQIRFIKEPGYIYDLFFIFSLNFNKDYYLTNYINYNKSSENTANLKQILDDFAPIPDELLPFFYMKDNKKNFMSEFYYEPFEREFINTYNLSTVQAALSNYGQVIENLIKYYFADISDKSSEECKNSVVAIGKLIKNSSYNSDLKSNLYSFFLDPIPVIQKLSYEFISKDFLLSKRHEKNYKLISELQQQFDFTLFNDKIKQYKNHDISLNSFENIYISICLLNFNCVKLRYLDDKAIFVLGCEYNECMDYLISEKQLPELDVFGNALSEKNRVEILDLIAQKNEITIRDVEQGLGFTGTNAYYHLSLMIKANMIRVRNQGRTMFYSINKHYFDMVNEMLSKYSNKKKGDQ